MYPSSKTTFFVCSTTYSIARLSFSLSIHFYDCDDESKGAGSVTGCGKERAIFHLSGCAILLFKNNIQISTLHSLHFTTGHFS